MASHHQWPYIEELATSFGYEVIWVTLGSNENEMREKMGWPVLDGKNLKLVPRPSAESIQKLLAEQDQNTLHVFSWTNLKLRNARYFCASHKNKSKNRHDERTANAKQNPNVCKKCRA